jgi:hypothetical protein
VDRALVAVFVIGTVAAFLLAMAGRLVLHGSVVAAGSLTIGFIGRSGGGKSTIAALCCAAGASLVSDDVIPVDSDGWPSCLGGWPELRLRQSASSIVQLFPSGVLTRTTADGRYAVQPAAVSDARPLTALIVARPSPGVSDVVASRLTAGEAALVLLRAGRIERWQASADRRRQFDLAMSVASCVPVLAADVPWRLPFSLDDARRLLIRLTDHALSPPELPPSPGGHPGQVAQGSGQCFGS